MIKEAAQGVPPPTHPPRPTPRRPPPAGTPHAAQCRKVTEEGLEANLAVNYLGNFLLTTQLLPLLKQSGDGRVLCVNSSLHKKVGGARDRPIALSR